MFQTPWSSGTKEEQFKTAMSIDKDQSSHVKLFLKKPACPFCGLDVDRPKELDIRRQGEMPVGSCTCGAVYAYDVTGHSLGAAFVEALVFACNMDWDLAWQLSPGEDYLEKLVENYDIDSHLIVPSGSHQGRRVSGGLYFIRMHNEILEATREGVEKKLDRAVPVSVSVQKPAGLPAEKALTRKNIEELVRAYQVETLVRAAGQDKRMVRELQRLLYSSEELVRYRTAEILGKSSAIIARNDPGTVSNLMQRLLNTIANPGASSWGAIDTIGEIIASTPALFAGYLPTLYQFLEDDMLRPRILRAIGKAAEARPDLLRGAIFRLLPFLRHPDGETRGYAARLFGFLSTPEAKGDLEQLLEDSYPITLYRNGSVEQTTVGRLSAEALGKLSL